MTPDYDLSNLEPAQANLWLYLHMDDIWDQIAAGGAGRATPQPLGEPRYDPWSRNWRESGKAKY